MIFEDHCESLFIEIDKSVFGTGRDLLIAVIIDQPTRICNFFTDVTEYVFEKLQSENKRLKY